VAMVNAIALVGGSRYMGRGRETFPGPVCSVVIEALSAAYPRSISVTTRTTSRMAETITRRVMSERI